MAAGAPQFDDGKEAGALRTIGEVSKALKIKQHVLRYWEQQFPMLQPLKRSGGRRYYRSEDIELVQTIDRLVNQQGYTLKGARLAIERGDEEPSPANFSAPAAEPEAPKAADRTDVDQLRADLIPQLRAIRSKLASALEG